MKCEEAVLVALMLLTSLTCSKCRYIDPPDRYQAERDYTVQDSSSAEDADLEELMSNYYDQLMNELTTLEKEMEREMREVKLVEKQQDNVDQLMEVSLQLNQQSKYQFDDANEYDYPADAPINPADQPKVLELSVVGVDYNGTQQQQQQQTPQMLNVTLDESERVKVQRESTADEEAIER